MNILFQLFMKHSQTLQNIGFAMIRIGIGGILLIFGLNKLTSGSTQITHLGHAMALFGITKGYVFWGYMAALTELLGGILYIIGLCTRLISLPLIWLLVVAIRFHTEKGDSFAITAFPGSLLIIAIAFLIAGSGIYSMDYCLIKKKENKNI